MLQPRGMVNRQGFMGVIIVGIAFIAASCSSSSHTASSAPTTIAKKASVISPTTTPTCPGPPVTLPAGGQALVPVAVPCGCPRYPMTHIPQTDIARDGPATDAALRWIRHVNPKWRDTGRVSAVYVVGETSQGQFGQVYALNVPKYCGQAVADASYVVEMANPAENDTGREADVVVAHFASGWQVWGSFHP